MHSEEVKFKRKIKESFFNPMFHFLPTLSLVVLDDFFSFSTACLVSIVFAVGIGFYVKFSHDRIFDWHKNFTWLFLFMCLVFNLSSRFFGTHLHLIDELILVSLLVLLFLFKKQIELSSIRHLPKDIPMTNNFNEMYNIAGLLIGILALYVLLHLYIGKLNSNQTLYSNYLNYSYIISISALWLIETLRVSYIRQKLSEEEWWPVVSEQGRVIGSIQHITSLNDQQKFLHPVVRVILIDKGKVFLEKRMLRFTTDNGLWDTPIWGHLKFTETIEQGVKRIFLDNRHLELPKYFHLSTHQIETINEKQYVFLFVSCQVDSSSKCDEESNNVQTKWWTSKQINENLESQIFTESFKHDYRLLIRSGLLESGKCECACRLRQTIYNFKNDSSATLSAS
jgi:hypothetical protein